MIRDFSCLLCLTIFIVSNIIQIIATVDTYELSKNFYNEEDFFDLNPEFLEKLWLARSGARFLELDVTIFNAVAWFSIVIPITQVAYLLSEGGKRNIAMHISIVALVLGGSMSELLSHLMSIGLNSSIRWLVNDFNLQDWGVSESADDGVGWRIIEILQIMGNGIMIWVDACEWLALAGITFLIALSIKIDRKEVPTFSPYLGGLSLVIMFFSIITFASNVYKVTSFQTWVPLTITTTVFNAFILLPMFLYNLSGAIPNAKARFEEIQTEENGEEVEIVSIS